MLIDWFTVIAQIVNFLVLVYLLKRFLYGPIIRAMDERENRIAAQLKEAEQREEEARREFEQYEEKNRILDSQREVLMSQIKEDVEVQRKELMGEARQEIDAIRSNWYQTVEREKEAFLQDLRERTGKHACAVARRALEDLGHVELEHHVVRIFIERLRGLDMEEQKALEESVQSKGEISVTSAFELSHEALQEIKEVLIGRMSDAVELRFETSRDLICGIELKAHGRKVAWSVRDYLEGLETTVMETLKGETRGSVEDRRSGSEQEERDEEPPGNEEGIVLGKE